MPFRPIPSLAVGVGLGLLVSSTSLPRAQASGILVARFGGEHGHPTTSNPTAMYFNPAGLALEGGTRVFAEGLVALRFASYDRPVDAISNPGPGTPNDALTANSAKAELTNQVVSPFVGVASNLGVPNLGVGLGFYVPFGGTTIWDQNQAYEGNSMYPGAVDGVQRWFTIEGTIRSSYITAAGAYRFPSIGLSVGLGLNLVRENVDTVRARNADGTDDLVNPDGSLKEGRSRVDVSGWTFALGAGVIWQPSHNFWLGLSYQSQPGFGTTTQTGTITNKLPGLAPVVTDDIDIKQSLPDVIRLGARYRPTSSIELRAWGEFVRWSTFESQCILAAGGTCNFNPDGTANNSPDIIANLPRFWEDTFMVRASGSWFMNDAVELILGAGYDGNAIPDRTLEPTFFDMDKVWIAAGGRFGLLDRALHLTATLTQIIYFERTIESQEPFMPPTRVPEGSGKYTQSITVLNVAVEYEF